MPVLGNISADYPHLLELENKIKLLEPFRGAKLHTKMKCMLCDHVWIATPLAKRQAYKKTGVSGCPMCNAERRAAGNQKTQQIHLDKLKEMGVEVISNFTSLRSTLTKLKFRNVNCGHEFETYPGNAIELGTTCTVCGKLDRTNTITAWSKANSAKWKETATEWQRFKAEVSALTEQTYKQHRSTINPLNLPRNKAGVEGAYHLDHMVPKRYCFDNNIPAAVCADASNLQMIGWRENIGSRSHIKGSIPPLFFNYVAYGTKLEQYAAQLKTIFPMGELFVRIGDTVVTLYDNLSNRAIVVVCTDQKHANQKSALSAAKSLTAAGVQFIILFEDEMQDSDLLHAKLRHYTGHGTSTRIHARHCEIRACSRDEKRDLLNTNHVQGNDNAQVNYGAYYNNKLVAVMTFAAPRVALGAKGNKDRTGMWELSRFCTDVSVRIPGIASKLLTHFKRNHVWKEIYSYADKRWSVGNMYHQLGFDLVADNPPDYFYVINGVRKHRWNYRKDILKNTLKDYDPLATEYQNMVNHGYWRVWDCGTLKFSVSNA